MTRPDNYSKEKRKAYNAKYHKANREKILKRLGKYRKANREKINEKARAKYWSQFLDTENDALKS